MSELVESTNGPLPVPASKEVHPSALVCHKVFEFALRFIERRYCLLVRGCKRTKSLWERLHGSNCRRIQQCKI